MSKKEKIKKIARNFMTNHTDWFSAFRHNMFLIIDDEDITLRWISEQSHVSYATLNSILYGSVKNPRIDVIVKVAGALGLTVDELIGAETIEPETMECIVLSRELKDHHRYVIRSFVRHQYLLHGQVPKTSKQISVFLPECQSGYLKTTNVTEAINIDHLQPGTRSRVCMGIRIPCHHYEPYFMKNEIILLGADRDGLNNEKCVVSHNGNYYICIKRIEIIEEKRIVKYLSLMDGKNILFTSDEIDDKQGYVIGFLYPDNTFGMR